MSVRFMEMPYKCSVIIFYCFQLNDLGMNGEKVVATKEEVRNQMYWSVRGETCICVSHEMETTLGPVFQQHC